MREDWEYDLLDKQRDWEYQSPALNLTLLQVVGISLASTAALIGFGWMCWFAWNAAIALARG